MDTGMEMKYENERWLSVRRKDGLNMMTSCALQEIRVFTFRWLVSSTAFSLQVG